MSGSTHEGADTRPSIADVIRAALPSLSQDSCLSTAQWAMLRAILRCRTPQLGEHRYRCRECGKEHRVPHSCRNRHCPQCQGAQAKEWLERQRESLLPIPYFHLVFTLPHALNPLIRQNPRKLYGLLFAAVSQTLLEFGQNNLGAQLGVTMVLHTWGQSMQEHLHVHCVVTGGGLNQEGTRWIGTSPHYLFSVKALSKVFGGKFRDGLRKLHGDKKLEFHGALEALKEERHFQGLIREISAHEWVVYAKRPFAGPEEVLAYLSRYTHRVAISPSRILKLEGETGEVTFTWKDYAAGGCRKEMKLGAREFVLRFAQHCLPARFTKIRHFGLLGNRNRKKKVEQARACLGVKAAELGSGVQEAESKKTPEAEPRLICPHCKKGVLELVAITGFGVAGLDVTRLDTS